MEKFAVTSEELASQLEGNLFGDGSVPVTSVTHDSRQAGPGVFFVAIKGLSMDGHRFIPDVMAKGAIGVISEEDPGDSFDGVWIKVGHARSALAKAAAAVFGDPSRKLDLVGITGTNGKTTTTYLCYDLIVTGGRKGAMLTTVEYRIADNSETATRTTPEASDTNRFLRQAVDAGCDFAVMESSSQAMHLHRCDSLHYKVAVFTNLTRDHLDYHGTMENYFDAKKMLFDGRLGEAPVASVVNIDDEWGRKLHADLAARGQNVLTFGIDNQADLSAADIAVSLDDGTSFELRTPQGVRRVTSPLVGRPHVYNILSATGAAMALGCGLDDIVKGISSCKGAPGRFERVENASGIAVVVDYAHTDDALENTISTARNLTGGRVITVFGCGGDRDRTKRAPMGRIASALSDFSILTSDNPRSEDPMQILRDIETGAKEAGGQYLLEPDRRSAIQKGIAAAKSGDVVLICGKGHETYQIIGGATNHFDDREVARETLDSLPRR